MPPMIGGEIWSESLLAALAIHHLQRKLSRLERLVALLERRRKRQRPREARPQPTRSSSARRRARLVRRARRRRSA
jgi:hypothetical protein